MRQLPNVKRFRPSSLASSLRARVLCGLLLLAPLHAGAQEAERKGLALKDLSFPASHASFSILAVDVNHDQNVDLVLGGFGVGRVFVYLGKGDGTFAQVIESAELGHNLRGLGAGDFNRDGRLDLVVGVTSTSNALLLSGLGNGTFSPSRPYTVGAHPFMLTVSDLNQDDIPDVAISSETPGGVEVMLADGRGGFKQSRFPTGKWSSDVAAADLNGDGKKDLAVTNWGDNNVSLLFGSGDGQFAPPHNVTYEGNPWDHHALYRVLAADLDRDGKLDMLWNDLMKAALYIRYGDGRGNFPTVRSVPAGRGVRHAAVADLDGNGWLDLVSANTAMDNLSIMLSDGKGAYLPTQYVPVGSYPRTVALADFNGDGRTDIAAATMMTKQVTVLLNTGETTLSAEHDLVMAFKPGAEGDLSRLSVLGPLVIASDGHLLVADEGNDRIARIDPGSGAITTVAGVGRAGFSGDGGRATAAALDRPASLVLAPDGSIFFSDYGNHRVRKIDAAGTITTVAGIGSEGFSGDGGPAVHAALAYPVGLARAADGSLFVADSLNYRIRRIAPDGIITTIAGTGVAGNAGDGGPAAKAELRVVSSLTIAADGSLLIAEQQNAAVRKIDARGIISTIAGVASGALVSPAGIALSSDGSLLIADAGAHAVRKLTADGRVVDVVSSEVSQAAASRAAEGRPWGPYSVAAAADGTVYFSDRNNDCIRRVDPSGSVSVVAGRADELTLRTYNPSATAESLPLLPPGSPQPVSLSWEHHFFSGSDDNAAHAVTVGSDGAIYVAGDVGTGAEFHVLQLSSTGKPGWSFDIKGPNVDVGTAITSTPGGTIVAAGTMFHPEPRRRDLTVVALNQQGQEQWRVVESEPGDQLVHGMCADQAGNLFVAGDSNRKLTLWALSPTGAVRWRYTGNDGSAHSVVADDQGNLYIAGVELDGWRVIALSPAGEPLWQHGIAGKGEANGIALTPAGNILVTGSRTPRRITVRAEQLDRAGTLAWEYEAINDAGPALGRSIVADTSGNAFIVGEVASDWLLLSLDPHGKRRWYFNHDGGGTVKNRDQPFDVVLKDGQLIVVGRVHPLPPKPPSLGQVEWRIASYALPQ